MTLIPEPLQTALTGPRLHTVTKGHETTLLITAIEKPAARPNHSNRA